MKRVCVYMCVCVFQPVCNAGKGDGQQGCVLLGICMFDGPSNRRKKRTLVFKSGPMLSHLAC